MSEIKCSICGKDAGKDPAQASVGNPHVKDGGALIVPICQKCYPKVKLTLEGKGK
jgi:hypothetical protein